MSFIVLMVNILFYAYVILRYVMRVDFILIKYN